MASKNKPGVKMGSDPITELGFKDEAKIEKFLSHPSNKFIQKKFDQVFPRNEAPKFSSASELSKQNATASGVSVKSAIIEESVDELDFGSGLDMSSGDEVMSNDDKELDLGDSDSLSLGDDSPSDSAPLEEGLDLSLDSGDLSLGDDSPLESSPMDEGLDLSMESGDLSLGDDAPTDSSADSTMTGLKIGDDVNLADDVMAKLAEIDDIMEADATNASLAKPDLKELTPDTDPGLSLGEMDLGNDEDLISADSLVADDSLSLGGDELSSQELTDDEEAGEDFLAMPSLGEDLEESTASGLTDPGEISGPGFDALGDEDEGLFEPLAAAETKPEIKEVAKKSLPKAPEVALNVDESDEDEGLAFTMEDVSEPILPKPKKADKTAELPIPEGFGKKKEAEPVRVQSSNSEERSSYKEVVGNYNHELERLQATLNHLRADRAELLSKIETLEEDKITHSRHFLGMRAELDEKKIEVQLLKKRMLEESQDLKYQYELEQERRKLAEERAKAYQAEVQGWQQKVKLEVKKVSSREKELEQKLELLKADAETQIRHRDLKILELKRRIDAMEFDLDTMNAMEQKSVGDKHDLENKLDKAIKTLRTAIGILETDDPKLATLEKLKKNLEV
ncbi:MAG: hypothetical protein K2P81_02615 [Bacteriovoracaceae bacterium]|nr:hypothetical protein [Bacteriovoracaceae bacterium]